MSWKNTISKATKQPSGKILFEQKFITSGIEAVSSSVDANATVEWTVQLYEQSATPTGNILTDPRAIPSVCNWADFPTMPQVYVHGELIGGSDIALEMLQDGSRREMFAAGRDNPTIYNIIPMCCI